MLSNLLINRDNWDDLALIERNQEITYRELIRSALAVRQLLPETSQKNIALFLPDGSSFISAFFAVLMAGFTVFPLNASMTRHEAVPLLDQASVSVLITLDAYRGLFECVHGLKIICIERTRGIPFFTNPPIELKIDEPAVLLATSGTTGKSKIVQLSQRNIETSVLGYIDKMNFCVSESLRFVLAAPYSSAYGIMILSACLMKSFPLILMDGVFTLDALYRLASEHKVTNYEGGALPIQLMDWFSDRLIPYDISTLKYFGFGGSKIPGGTIARVMAAYPGIGFYQGYGMTEASPLITKHQWQKLERPDSVGNAIKGVELAVEADGLISHTPHTMGEILVKGGNVMLGYYDNEAETQKVIKDGYLYTGDIGYLDEEGYLYICGRKKNIMIIRGLTVYPEEVEACIMGSPFSRDCFVYGRSDGVGNEVVCADVVPADPQVTAADIMAWCTEHLTGYKRPGQVTFCEAIRKNSAGKTERVISQELDDD